MTYPTTRPRRLRHHPLVRALVRETTLSPADFILPLFVRPGRGVRKEIASMPGNYQLSVDALVEEVGRAIDLGVCAFILFGIPTHKDPVGAVALEEQGIVQQALRALKAAYGDKALLLADECFCEYTDHGHCGVLSEKTGRLDLDNDATLPNLAAQCVSHARAGADIVAPSGMLDGMVAAIRKSLDDAGLAHVPIMAYSAKYASGFYGPFRDAAESPPQFGDLRDSGARRPASQPPCGRSAHRGKRPRRPRLAPPLRARNERSLRPRAWRATPRRLRLPWRSHRSRQRPHAATPPWREATHQPARAPPV